ncbi:ABC transporter permease [Burkholderia sp. Ac-20365]|uniref:ABC transporter permease n=1 Tax=Burkholderia sp. Ac-20365 TaxID=2703897 RepID=UPI00197C9E11|nr:ABC transporter permease [Burkholderia sp. Ac-20365]MBN3766179.1 ABC transporter permease [Burkholderia sp. Ac-20365]
MNFDVQTTAAAVPVARKRPSRSYTVAQRWWALPALAFLAVFFLIPLLENVVRSVTGGAAATSGHFVYYRQLFTDPYYLGILGVTLKVSCVTTFFCLIVGYPIAYFMCRHAGRASGAIVFCLVAPLLTSIIMRTFGWNVLLARKGLLNVALMKFGLIERAVDILNSPVSVYLGLVHVMLPFMVLSISSILQSVDLRLEDSARSLGAGRLRAFLSVTLPLSFDGILTGCILVFVITNGSFLTMLLLGGGKVTTIALLIYQQFNVTQDVAFAAAMGNVLLLVALIGLVLQARLVRKRNAKS